MPLDLALIDAAAAEFALRDPGFLGRRPIGFAPVGEIAAAHAVRPPFEGVLASDLETALAEGLERFGVHGLQRAGDPGQLPLAAEVVVAAILDAFSAAEGRTRLAAPAAGAGDFLSGYEARQAGDVRYLVRGQGSRWLLLVNAVGIPLSLWSRLLGDPSHDYRILVVEPGCHDLVLGGMDRASGVAEDAGRIQAVLAAEGVEDLHVVGWCSGGRTAVEVAARERGRVRSVILDGCSFRGVAGIEPRPTQFERDVAGVVDGVVRQPSSAAFLSRLLVQAPRTAPPPADAVPLFRLAAKAHGEAVLAPFADGDRLSAYCARLKADADHPTAQALADLAAPVLMVAGEHDQIVDNAVVWETLTRHARSVSGVSVSGAGHYVHDLQYAYFRLALDAFTRGETPPETARMKRL